ncbi:hypothetical protein D3C78_1698510 [compost metagenome]
MISKPLEASLPYILRKRSSTAGVNNGSTMRSRVMISAPSAFTGVPEASRLSRDPTSLTINWYCCDRRLVGSFMLCDSSRMVTVRLFPTTALSRNNSITLSIWS